MGTLVPISRYLVAGIYLGRYLPTVHTDRPVLPIEKAIENFILALDNFRYLKLFKELNLTKHLLLTAFLFISSTTTILQPPFQEVTVNNVSVT